MKDLIYFDRFEKIYVKDKNAYAPPERYLEVTKNNDNYYGEIWHCGCGVKLSLFYDENDKPYASVLRRLKEEDNNVKVKFMERWVVPSYLFDEILKEVEE